MNAAGGNEIEKGPINDSLRWTVVRRDDEVLVVLQYAMEAQGDAFATLRLGKREGGDSHGVDDRQAGAAASLTLSICSVHLVARELEGSCGM